MRIQNESYHRLLPPPPLPPRGILPGFAPKEWVTGETGRRCKSKIESYSRLPPFPRRSRHPRNPGMPPGGAEPQEGGTVAVGRGVQGGLGGEPGTPPGPPCKVLS